MCFDFIYPFVYIILAGYEHLAELLPRTVIPVSILYYGLLRVVTIKIGDFKAILAGARNVAAAAYIGAEAGVPLSTRTMRCCSTVDGLIAFQAINRRDEMYALFRISIAVGLLFPTGDACW